MEGSFVAGQAEGVVAGSQTEEGVGGGHEHRHRGRSRRQHRRQTRSDDGRL